MLTEPTYSLIELWLASLAVGLISSSNFALGILMLLVFCVLTLRRQEKFDVC